MGLEDYFINKHGSHKNYFLFLGKAQEWQNISLLTRKIGADKKQNVNALQPVSM